ncbi:MAG: DNA polymerase III subunit gamma/tau [Bryobacteraceae bacterium]
MYQVIARKYRPQSFREVVNQEHVKTTLEHAIAQNRIAHGYIFSGQRGTGKTTVARILARCLNCVNGPAETPCGVCASCTEIAAGGSVDVIEIDAASNRGINEMRELRENVRYQPARDRYKVFIIDEAHQITNEAFNALLKTIEEPPPWVVFVLCTTEAHKIPATIASRCQHFSFRSVEFEDLVARMAWICEQEGIEASPDSLSVLAQAGEGSVRDSLSALDQAIACCGAKLEAADVRALLGAFSLEALEQVSQALAESHSGRMLEVVDELERNGRNLQHFSRELARYFRNLLVARIAGPSARLIAASPAERERLAATAARFSEEDLTRYLHLALELFRDLQSSLQPRFHLEIGLVRMVQAGKLLPIEEALAQLPKGGPGNGPAPPRPAPAPEKPQKPSPFELDRARKAAPPASVGDWRTGLHHKLMELGMSFTADAVERSRVEESNGELRITAPKSAELMLKAEDVGKAARELAGRALRVRIAFEETVEPQTPIPASEDELKSRALQHPEVRRYRELFGGEVSQVRNLKE